MNKQENILVLGGDSSFQQSMQSDLSGNYQIDTCNNLAGCLSSVKEGKPNLLLIDTSISSAYKVCEEIKGIHPKMDIILLSERSNADDIVKGYNAGASDYLVKPIYMKELSAKLSLLLQSQTNLIASEEANRDAQQVAFSAMIDSSQLDRIYGQHH